MALWLQEESIDGKPVHLPQAAPTVGSLLWMSFFGVYIAVVLYLYGKPPWAYGFALLPLLLHAGRMWTHKVKMREVRAMRERPAQDGRLHDDIYSTEPCWRVEVGSGQVWYTGYTTWKDLHDEPAPSKAWVIGNPRVVVSKEALQNVPVKVWEADGGYHLVVEAPRAIFIVDIISSQRKGA